MTEKEFEELKVGDKVCAFVLDKKRTAVIESIARDTGRCTARFDIPLEVECYNYCGTRFRFEPATKIVAIEADFNMLEIVKEEKQ